MVKGRGQKGFTFIEIIVVLGIFAILASVGLFVSFDFYRSYAFRSERNIVISILQKARAQALNNINQEPHGVKFLSNSYVIFQGADYEDLLRDTSFDEAIDAANSVAHSGLDEVVFEQLSGDASASGEIILSDGVRTVGISINNEGRTSW